MKPFALLPSLRDVVLADAVLAPRQAACVRATIPSSIEKCRQTHCLDAFRLDWKKDDPWMPHVFWDSDVAKVLEGAAYALLVAPDSDGARRAELDALARLVCSAQQPDGYLNTHFTLVEPENRFTALRTDHELYCAGHLIEAAVAHHAATGETFFLDTMRRYADLLVRTFGRGPGQRRGIPGHEELELALAKLFDVTGERAYLDLADYFLSDRGAEPSAFSLDTRHRVELTKEVRGYFQDDAPVREQRDAHGHAVRATYLYCGMVDVAVRTDDAKLLAAAERLFDNIATRRMYVTGGIGSYADGERFGGDFDLPQDSYAESCASIGLALLARRLLSVTGKSSYADVLERVLYNGALSGISLSGDRFFYANKMEVLGNSSESDNERFERVPWFGCSCCPTNYCRFLPQLGPFLWSLTPEGPRLEIPAASRLLWNGAEFAVEGDYPFDGHVVVRIVRAPAEPFTLSLRIPTWCPGAELRVNGATVAPAPAPGAYAAVRRAWKAGDRMELNLAMPARLVRADPRVESCRGKVALLRGPVVHCLESVDNPGLDVAACALPPTLGDEPDYELLATDWEGGTRAPRVRLGGKGGPVFVPYALWNNRGASRMRTWVPVG